MPTSFPWRKTFAVAALFSLIAALPLSFTASVKNQKLTENQAQAAAFVKSVDIMKYTKDVMTNQPDDATIQNLVDTVAQMHPDYVAISVPMDSDADYPGTKPGPRTSVQFVQKLADTIHNKGLKVLWRGTWAGIEGIYGFPKRTGSNRFPAGTAASAPSDGDSTWLGKTYQYIVSHPTFFKDGDIWAPLPERTEGIFSDSTSFLPSDGAGLQANYVKFFNDLKTVSENAFSRIGRNMLTGMTANNYSEVMSTWLPQDFFDFQGITAIDYYGISHTPQEIDSDLRKMYAMHGKQIFLQEWGDYWNQNMSQQQRTDYLNQVYAVLQKLVNDDILAGFNYWGGWDNNAEGLLTRDASGFHLNYRGQILANFFAANSSGSFTPPPPASGDGGGTTPPPVNPPSTVTCASPANNAFTGCYYNDQNLNNAILSRTDNSINFDWGGGSPDSKVPVDNFSVRWQGNFNFNAGTYTFTATADDGIKVYIDNNLIIDQWKDQPATTYTANANLTAGNHLVKVEYYENGGGAVAKVNWQQNQATPPPPPAGEDGGNTGGTTPPPSDNTGGAGNFSATYFKGVNLSQAVLNRTDQAINFTWNDGSPDPVVPKDQFSARWQGNFNFNAGDYTFNMTSDDGSRLYIDGQLVLNDWSDHAARTKSVTKTMTAGTHNIKMEYYEAYGGAIAKLNWNQTGSSAGSGGTVTPPPVNPPTTVGGFVGNYFRDKNLSQLALTRNDGSINFTWNDASPDPSLPKDLFSARWTGDFSFTAGNHTFNMTSDDGARLYIDGQLVINDWNDHASRTDTITKYLSAGTHNIKMEYYEAYGGAIAKLSWN